MKIFDRRLRISDSLKISDFSNSLGCCSTPPQQNAYAANSLNTCTSFMGNMRSHLHSA